MTNPNCDGGTENNCNPNQEVRILPYGGDGNLIVCKSCFNREMIFRRQRNQELAKDCQFALPAWNDLKVYGE